MDKPEIITKDQLAEPRVEQTEGMARGQAFAHDGVWAGYSVFPGGATTGWHHHGDYATYGYITEGTLILEHGDETLHVHAGVHPRPPRAPRERPGGGRGWCRRPRRGRGTDRLQRRWPKVFGQEPLTRHGMRLLARVADDAEGGTTA